MLIVYVESGLAVIKHMQLFTIAVFIINICISARIFYLALFMDLHLEYVSFGFITLNKYYAQTTEETNTSD